MDVFGLGWFGIFDILIAISFFATLFYYFKKGILTKIVEIANGLFGIFVSLLLAIPFNNWIVEEHSDLYLTTIQEILQGNITNAMINDPSIAESGNVGRALIEKLGLPEFVANMVPNIDSLTIDNVAQQLSSGITNNVIGIVIAFLILFFGTTILCFILKILIKILRNVPVFRVIDSIFGIVFGFVKYTIILSIVFLVLMLCLEYFPGISDLIGDFVRTDMQLGNDTFRLSKYLYEHNFLLNFLSLFF